MASNFFGRPNTRESSPSSSSPTSSSSSPASRRGKKNGSEKPKQPQRGLGVAQLEKIRLHGEMSCDNYNPSFYPQVTFFMHTYNNFIISGELIEVCTCNIVVDTVSWPGFKTCRAWDDQKEIVKVRRFIGFLSNRIRPTLINCPVNFDKLVPYNN